MNHLFRLRTPLLGTTLLLVLAVATIVVPVAAQVRVDNPACWGTTEDYITEEITVPIQPQTPVTIKRFQGPQLKLYCISFDEAGPSCSSVTTGSPQLCSREVSSSSSAYSCEDLTQFQSDPNSRITRGTVKGPDMIWLLKWDGTAQALSCYPKVVTARLLIFVQDSKVDSPAVLVIMLIIVIFCLFLIFVAFYSFLANRYAVIDTAGATTVGGPGATFRGPQMQVSAGGQGVVSHTRILLPVRQGDAGANDMRASKFGQMTTVEENMTTEQILMPNMKRTQRASPPRPGDGVRDGMFPSPGRRGGDFSDFDDGEDFYDDEAGYTSGAGGGGRGNRGRGSQGGGRSRGGNKRGGGGLNQRNNKKGSKYESTGANFPTQHNVETTGGAGFDGYDGDGAPVPKGIDGARMKQVKYIPRWMQGSFGRGGMVPEPLDGTFPEESNNTNTSITNRTIDMQNEQSVGTMGVYSRTSPRGKRGGTPERQTRGGDFGGPNGHVAGGGGSENRYGGQSSGLKHRRPGGAGTLSDRSPNNGESSHHSRRQLGYNSENEQQDSFRGNGGGRNGGGGPKNRNTPRQNLKNRLSQEDDEEEVDNFQRGKARLTSGQSIDPAGPSRDRASSRGNGNGSQGGGQSGPRGGGGLDGNAPLPSRMNTASMERPGAAAYRCNSCGYQLTGTQEDPPFCSVSGDRHY